MFWCLGLARGKQTEGWWTDRASEREREREIKKTQTFESERGCRQPRCSLPWLRHRMRRECGAQARRPCSTIPLRLLCKFHSQVINGLVRTTRPFGNQSISMAPQPFVMILYSPKPMNPTITCPISQAKLLAYLRRLPGSDGRSGMGALRCGGHRVKQGLIGAKTWTCSK